MLLYLIKSAACMSIFMVFYKLLLEKENMHVFKRFYLLLSIAASLSIPALVFTAYVVVEPLVYEEFQPVANSDFQYDYTPEKVASNILDGKLILWSLYLLGLFFFGFKFFKNLFQIIGRIRKNPTRKSTSIIHVLLKEDFPPHTFFKYIFLNKKKLESNEIPHEVLLHEETHALQKHSIDVLFIELLQVIFWFNPLVYLFKKAIKLNHEFLADRAVLAKEVDETTYLHTLLSYLSTDSENKYQLDMTNAINYSSIKKRFTVMKKRTSKKAILLRSLLLLPLLTLLIFGFTETKLVQQESEINKNIKDELRNIENLQVVYTGASEKMMKEYRNFIKSYTATKSINYKEYQRIVSIYDIMTIEQKKTVEKYPSFPAMDLKITETREPSESEFESFKNKKKYAVWLDGKVIENSFLNSYESSDIVHFSNSFVYKNARSARFPQKNQVSLYTEKGFEEDFIKRLINNYSKSLSSFDKNINKHILTGQLDNAELRLQKLQLEKMYESISNDDKKKYNVPPPKPIPSTTKSFKETINSQDGASPKQIADYNDLAKSHNLFSDHNLRPRESEIRNLTRIYNLMTEEQKMNAEIFPDYPPTQDGASPEQIAAYNALAKKYNTMLLKGKSIQIKLKDVARLEYIYSLMTAKQKADAEPFPNFPEPPPPPQTPNTPNTMHEMEDAATIIKQTIEKQDPYDVVGGNLSINKSSSINTEENVEVYIHNSETESVSTNSVNLDEELNRLAQEGAQFFYNDKKISTKEGLRLLESEEKLTVQTFPWTNKRPEVKLFKKGMDTSASKPPTPPLPPKPTTPLDHIIKMAKKEAIFLYEGKKISSDKAIELLKNNKNLNIDSKTAKGKKPVVKITTAPINH